MPKTGGRKQVFAQQRLKKALFMRRDLVCAIAAVTPESAHAAAARWLPTLFDVSQSKTCIVCHPSKVNDIQAAFDK